MSEKNEIFEPTIESLTAELEKLKGNKTEVAEPTPKPKVKKARKPLDEATKERLRAQLARGRATSLAKRRAKREQNKITKAKEIIAEEEEKEEIMPSTKTNEELQEELKALKEKMEKPKNKHSNKGKKKKQIIVEESESEEEESEEESEEEEVVVVKKKKVKKPKAQPKKEIVKEVSHIPIVEKKIEAPDPMAIWLQKRKKSKYS